MTYTLATAAHVQCRRRRLGPCTFLHTLPIQFRHQHSWLTPSQEVLRPVLLRRMKEDVEKLPDKEEVIIWVELSNFQRPYYRVRPPEPLTAHSGVRASLFCTATYVGVAMCSPWPR